MRKITAAIISATLVIIVAACSKAPNREESAVDSAPAPQASAKMAEADTAETTNAAAAIGEISKEVDKQEPPGQVTVEQFSSSAATYVDKERKFVRTANANFRVNDVYQSAIAIENIVSGLGGFVVTNQIGSQINEVHRYPIGNAKLLELAEYTVQGNLAVRVPSDKTQDFLRAMISQVQFLDQRNFEARDVQFELLRKQLEFLRNQETQKQLGALSTSPGRISDRADVIGGQNDARASRDEAVVMQKEIEDKVSFSTINLSLYQLSKVRKTEIDDVDEIAKASRPNFFKRLFGAVSEGWYGLLDLLVALSAVWPLWLSIAAVIYAFRRYRKNRKAKPQD